VVVDGIALVDDLEDGALLVLGAPGGSWLIAPHRPWVPGCAGPLRLVLSS
jgi:hypothetical protein